MGKNNRKVSRTTEKAIYESKYFLPAVVIALIGILISAFIYVISSVPPAEIALPEEVKDPGAKVKTTSQSDSIVTKDFSTIEVPEDEAAEFDELIQRKQVKALEEGWVNIRASPLPILKLSSSFQERQVQYAELIKDHTPTLLVDSLVAEKWPIFRWDLYAMSKRKNISLDNCRYQWASPIFLLGQEREKGGMLGSAHDLPLAYINVTMLQFLQSTFQEKVWLYWTDELSKFESFLGGAATVDHYYSSSGGQNALAKSAKKKSTGWEYFIIQEDNLRIANAEDAKERNNKFSKENNTATSNSTNSFENLNSNATKEGVEEEYDLDFWRPMVWISHPGVVAQAHYDTQHNIFIQVQGMKRFTLFPPSLDLSFFPNIHYSYRQSQVPFHLSRTKNLTEKDYPFNQLHPSNTTAYEVYLKPGDILYIPPFWTHLVESLSLSVSISILSPSTVEAALSEIYWQKVPFGEFRSSRFLRMKVIQKFFDLLFVHVSAASAGLGGEAISPEEFAERLYQSRFAPLAKGLMSPFAHLNPSYFCHDLSGSETSNEENRVSETIAEKNQEFHQLFLIHTQSISIAVLRLGAMLQEFSHQQQHANNDTYYEEVKRIFLQDYMEQLVRWAVGPQFTAYYLKHCFTQLKASEPSV